jgi:hypothetical protein
LATYYDNAFVAFAEKQYDVALEQGRQALTCLKSDQLTPHQHDEFLVLTLLRRTYTALNQVEQAKITVMN